MHIAHRRIFWTAIGAPLALIILVIAAAYSLPMTSHMISALWNMPDGLPALSTNSQVHYQPGAQNFARDVAALLPDAVARVEAVQGRRFAHPVVVGAYSTAQSYAAANGVGSDSPVGVTFAGRVKLSPKLFGSQRWRLQAILTHELSHAHIQGWINPYKFACMPNWFKEGLAVMVSEGGGAELVSEDEARAAIQRGEMIVVDDACRLSNLTDIIRLRKTPQNKPAWYPTVLAYREYGMFLSYLRESNRASFDRMMKFILDGHPLTEAVTFGYHDDVRSLWRKFINTNSH